MKTRLAHPLVLLGAGLGLFGSTGCQILPEAQSDPTRFYVLSAPTAAGAPAAGAPVVRVRAIEVAEYLRGRPMIVRRGGNEIEFREFARWGEPLEAGVGRVIREELLARGAAAAVLLPGGRREAATATFELAVRVLAAEGGRDGSVQFRAGWELVAAADGAIAARGDFRAAGQRWDGKNEAALAAGLSEAVGALAGEISAALPKR